MNTILRTFISICLLISMGTQVFAYELTTKDQTIVSNVTKKLESFITKKWESYRKKVISLLEQFSLQKKTNVRLFAVIQKTIEELNIEVTPKKTTNLYKAYTPSSIVSKNTTTSTKKTTASNDASIYFEPNNDSDNNQTSTTSVNIQPWNADSLYGAISGGKITKDIKNGTVRFDPSSLTQSMVLSAINRVRSDYGLSPLVFNELLAKAAKNHSKYADINGTSESHYETSIKNGFTWQWPENRAEYVGYSKWSVSENIGWFRWDIVTALRWLFYVPYHRIGFLENRKDVGFCLEKECYGIFVFWGEQTSEITHFIYPKNRSNIYDYNNPVNEKPSPFQWVLSGFVVSVMDAEWVNKNSLRLVDITDDKDIQVTFANEFSPTGQDNLSVTVKNVNGSNQWNSYADLTVHFINREPLKEGHVYMTEYSTTNVGDNVCKIRRSYFIAGEGSMPDASKLLPTESSQCGNIDPTSTSSSQLETWAIDITGNVYFISQKYGNDPEFNAFSYTDNTKKRNYNLSFSDADMTWLLARKQSTGQTSSSPEITGMYVVRSIHFKLSSVRKAESYGDASSNWGYELYNASASIVR